MNDFYSLSLTHKAANDPGVDEEDTPSISGSNSHISGGAVAAIVIVLLLIVAVLPISAVLVGLFIYRKKVELQTIVTNYGMLYNHPTLIVVLYLYTYGSNSDSMSMSTSS